MRDHRLYLEDILQAIKSVETYVKGFDFDKFKKNKMVVDAVVRNLEIIGEASKNIPADIKKENPGVEWRKIAGLRDILAHEYFVVDIEVLWDVIVNKIPNFKKDLTGLLKKGIE